MPASRSVSTLGFTNVYNIGGFVSNPGISEYFPTEGMPEPEPQVAPTVEPPAPTAPADPPVAPPASVPPTGDTLFIWIGLAVLALGGLFFLSKKSRKTA